MPKVLRRINQVEDSPEEKRRLALVSCPEEIKNFVSCLKNVLAQNLQSHIPAGNVFDETNEELEERKEIVTFLLTIRLSKKSPSYIAEYLESGRECIAKSHLVPEYWYELNKLRSLRIQHEKINNLSLGSKDRIIEEQKLAHKDAGLIDAINPVGWSTNFNYIAQALGCNSGGTNGLFTLKHLQEFSSSLIYDQFAIVPLKAFHTFLIEKEKELKTQLLIGNSECDLRIFIRYLLASTTVLLNSGYPDDYKYIVRRFGASGALSPFVRVHHQLKYSGTRWEKSSDSANTDAILFMIAPLMKDENSFTSRYVGMAPSGNGNSFVLEAGLSIHQETSSLFQSSYTNVTCGGVRLPHDFWPYGKGGTLDTHCQALEAIRILIQKYKYMFLSSKSVANKEVISYVSTVSSRLAVALTEVAASVHGGCINTQTVASINSNARLCFHNENDERSHGSGGKNEDLSLLGGMFVLFGDLLRPTKYPDLLLSKPAMTHEERDGLIQAFLPLFQELGVAHELAITMSTELFTFASHEEATSIRNDLTSLQLAYTGPGIFSSLPEGGLPRFDGAIVSAGQVDLLSYAVGTPSFQTGGEGIKRTIFSSEGVLSMTHATMLLSRTPPLNNGGNKISMLETLTKATLSSKQLQAGGDSSEIARKRGQQIIGEIIDKGTISFDTCFKHNGEVETKCGRAPIPKDRDDTTLITILQLARQNGVKSLIVRSNENSEVVEKILTSIDTFGVGEDAVNFKSMVVTNVLKPYLVQMVGKPLAETHSIDRVKVLLVLVKCLNKPSKAILVYLNVYHPCYQLGAILRGGFNDSGVDFFVKYGLVEYLYGGGSFFNYLCGDVYKSPITSGFGEFFTTRDHNLDYTSPSRLAAFLKRWMSSNGGLRGSVDDLLVIKVLQLLARAKENNDQDDIERAEALLVEALAECARISKGKAEGGLTNRIAAIGSDVFTVTFEKGLNSICLNVSSCGGRYVYFNESHVKKLTFGFDTSSTGIKPLFEKFKSNHPWQTTLRSDLRSSANKELNEANIRIVKVVISKFNPEKLLMIQNGAGECEVVFDDTSTTITSSGFDAAHTAHDGFGTIVTCLFCTENSPFKACIADHMHKCHKDKLAVSTLHDSFKMVYADTFPVTNISSSISSSTFDSGTQLAALITADVSLLEQKVMDVFQAVEFHLACGQVNGAARWLQFLLTLEAMTPGMIASTYIRLAQLYHSMDDFSSSRESLIACCDFCMGKKDLLSTQIVLVNSQEDEENTVMSSDSSVISNSSSLVHRPDLLSYAFQACLMLCDVYKKADEHQATNDLCVRAQRYIANSASSTSSTSMTSVDLPISLIVKYGCSQLHLKDYTNASKILAPLFLLDVKVVPDLIMELGLELMATGYWNNCLYVLRKLRNPGLASSSSTITGSSSSNGIEVIQDPFSFIIEFWNFEKQAQVLVCESVCFDAIDNPQKSARWLLQASRLLPTSLDIAENAAKHLETIGQHLDAAALLSNEILIDSLPTPNKVVDVLLDAARFLGDPFPPDIMVLDDYTNHKCKLFCRIFMEAMGVSNRHVSSQQCQLRISATKNALGEEKVKSLIDSVHKHLTSIGEHLMASRFISEIKKHEAAKGSSILQAEVSEDKQLSQVASSSHEKPQCDYCDERPNSMNKHLSARHNIGKFYKCLYCEYEIYQKGDLVRHIYNNHNDKPEITSKQAAHELVYVDSYPFELKNGKRIE
jgi:hypothetical protein